MGRDDCPDSRPHFRSATLFQEHLSPFAKLGQAEKLVMQSCKTILLRSRSPLSRRGMFEFAQYVAAHDGGSPWQACFFH